MKTILAACLLAGAAAVLSAPTEPVEAAVIAMGVEELSAGADVILRAQVAESDVHWSADGVMIETDLVLQPVEFLKGPVPGNLTVRVPGGDLDGIKIRNGEAPGFAVGEDVVVFLRQDPSTGLYSTYGWFQGKYTILGDHVRELNDRTWSSFRLEIIAALQN